jgi:hypothetical protein
MSKSRKIAERLQKWLADQKYQGEPLLHAVVCCDFVSVQRFISAVEQIIDEELDKPEAT